MLALAGIIIVLLCCTIAFLFMCEWGLVKSNQILREENEKLAADLKMFSSLWGDNV